ncbi:MAG: type II toxin-antitoxin system RelE/ParE family toxin [Sulfuricurvum sp.]|jgi:addiction module RelE/StbE family toxin|uniref:type II toxin-antitoxin system RelE/ParE family toxin n=1 Tax=Sulfuricurvum sp. TaxID=2025608 RepID=UPI0025F27162|nr:type II toxin-antitoxin system RelE/ParE family toxin [Sulfuricurvum sp.]MCK9374247.1 type II toxin-antitoxin system RelE/ParE family toxin [Sulfuricurvum sp.]
MTFSVFWTETAQRDLSALADHIYQESPQNARNIFLTIRERAENLNRFPERGRVVPELADIGLFTYRELIIERWRLIYKINKDHVFVTALFDSRQNMEDILFQRLIRK